MIKDVMSLPKPFPKNWRNYLENHVHSVSLQNLGVSPIIETPARQSSRQFNSYMAVAICAGKLAYAQDFSTPLAVLYTPKVFNCFRAICCRRVT